MSNTNHKPKTYPRHRIDWIDNQNHVFIETADGSITVTLEELVRSADKVITGTFEPTNPGFRKSFKKLPRLVAAYDDPGCRA